ncbi:hypothetical protein OROHE_021551 [Orobanche hederae]
MILAAWCDEKEVEEDVKIRTKDETEMGAAKTCCIPFDQPQLPQGEPAKVWTYWGRSY